MAQSYDLSKLDPEHAYALSQRFGIVTKATPDGPRAMIGWFLQEEPDGDEDDAINAAAVQALALPYGERPEDLHLTLLYLGDPALYDMDLVAAVVKLFAVSGMHQPLEGCVSGLGRFVGDDDTDVVIALVDMQGLDCLRDCLIDQLCYAGALPIESPVFNADHDFMPHITLAYVPRTQASPQPLQETIPLLLGDLTVAANEQRVTFEIEPYYAYAYPEAADSASPYYAARSIVAKAGRMLSKKNLDLVVAAIDALTALRSAAEKEQADPETATKAAEHKAKLDETISMYDATGRKKDPDEGKTNEQLGQMSGPDNSGGVGTARDMDGEPQLQYLIKSADSEKRYTFGPLYAPMQKDAHGEFTDAETLADAVHEYVRDCIEKGSNRINLQHDDSGEATVGEWVEVCSWPYETVIKVSVPGGEEKEVTMPAGTVYMGVIWDERAWEEGIKKGRLTGYSLGGRAVRVTTGSDLPEMGYKFAASKRPPHEYDGGKDGEGPCTSCGLSESEGNHQ